MGIRLKRQKERVPLYSLVYRLHRLLPLSDKRKLGLYLDLEWMFDRLVMELSYRQYPMERHPHRVTAAKFLFKHLTSGMKVLDLGCAMGDFARMIAEQTEYVVGVDHNPDHIKKAKERHQAPNLEFVLMDVREYLGSQKKEFDTLILSHILEHLDNPGEFLLGMKDWFQFMYIEVPDFDKSYMNFYRVDLGRKLTYTDNDHVNEFDREELNALLSRTGFRVIEAEYRYGVQRIWCTASN